MKYGAEAVDSMKTCCFPSHAEHPEAMWFVFEKLNGKNDAASQPETLSSRGGTGGKGKAGWLPPRTARRCRLPWWWTSSLACWGRRGRQCRQPRWVWRQAVNASAAAAATEAAAPAGACSTSLLPCRLVLSAPQAEGPWAPGGGGRRSSKCVLWSQSYQRAFYTPEGITRGDEQSKDARSLLPALPPAPAPSSFLLILCFWNQTFVSYLERLGAVTWRANVPIVSPPSSIIFFTILKSDV